MSNKNAHRQNRPWKRAAMVTMGVVLLAGFGAASALIAAAPAAPEEGSLATLCVPSRPAMRRGVKMSASVPSKPIWYSALIARRYSAMIAAKIQEGDLSPGCETELMLASRSKVATAIPL